MSLLFQLTIFGVTGALLYYGVYYGTPKLVEKGIPLILAFWFFLWSPVLLLLPVSLILYYREVKVFSLHALMDWFHFYPLSNTDWFWVAGAILFTIIFDLGMEPLGKFFARIRILAPPSYLPAPFNPLKKMELPPSYFFGVKLYKNWKIIFIFVPLHLIAMLSEEMMWRGLILPIQQEIFGGWAWLLNGILWAWLVHACLKWHFINMLPSMLVAPWIAQFTGSTWASFATHSIGNSLLWVILIFGIIKNPSIESLNTSKRDSNRTSKQ